MNLKTYIYLPVWLLVTASPCRGELLMNTHGYISIAPFVHGFDNNEHRYPGYRSDFYTYVDFFRFNRVVLNSLLGTTTLISRPEHSHMKMDRMRYTLTPGFRYESNRWIIKGALHHECIHLISRPEIQGSVWWNSFQLGAGTKGAYYLYLRDEYRNVNNRFINSLDVQVNAGYIVPAKNTLLTGQNHEYRYEVFSVVRYHLGSFGGWAYFASLRQQLWIKEDSRAEHQINLTLNMFRKGTANFAGIFYNYSIYDTFSLDSTDGLGSLGFRIIF